MRATHRLQVKRLTAGELAAELRRYEQLFGVSAQDFYDHFRAGAAGDSPDAIRFAGLCDLAVKQDLLRARSPH